MTTLFSTSVFKQAFSAPKLPILSCSFHKLVKLDLAERVVPLPPVPPSSNLMTVTAAVVSG